jgi:hypothetical protein
MPPPQFLWFYGQVDFVYLIRDCFNDNIIGYTNWGKWNIEICCSRKYFSY